MAWESVIQRETDNWEIKEKWHENAFRPRQAPTPDFLEREHTDHYRKRLMDRARPLVAADLQEVKTQDLYGSALDHYEQRYFESAKAEAQRPTNIPDGELRQVTRYDQGGRPFYEFFGSPRAWLDNLSAPKKRLVGIRTENVRGYRPANLGLGAPSSALA
jgi:hypothetical protein